MNFWIMVRYILGKLSKVGEEILELLPKELFSMALLVSWGDVIVFDVISNVVEPTVLSKNSRYIDYKEIEIIRLYVLNRGLTVYGLD